MIATRSPGARPSAMKPAASSRACWRRRARVRGGPPGAAPAPPVAPGEPAIQRIDADGLMGVENGDGAAVVRIGDGRAVVPTADFFGPVVDDAYTFGRIAGTNALSDVYAVGGTPLVALNLLGWPRAKLP